jgi:hypothetical protein
MNNMDLLSKGYEHLTEKLGLVDAERFIALIISEPFNYTEWRKENLFEGLTIRELSKKAMEHRNSIKD